MRVVILVLGLLFCFVSTPVFADESEVEPDTTVSNSSSGMEIVEGSVSAGPSKASIGPGDAGMNLNGINFGNSFVGKILQDLIVFDQNNYDSTQPDSETNGLWINFFLTGLNFSLFIFFINLILEIIYILKNLVSSVG